MPLNEKQSGPEPPSIHWGVIWRNTGYILLALLVFLLSLDLMLSSLQHLGRSAAETIILATSNPFTSLFIGLLVTAIIQSSTATTSMTVALVATGSLTLESAVPIIMGANIGTTITSTIVSLGFVTRKKEFRRAVSAGTYHDFFNILTATILFPLEYYFQFLSRISEYLASSFFKQPIQGKTEFTLMGGFSRITDWVAQTIDNGLILIIISFAFLFGSIIFFRRVLTNLLGFGSPEKFQQFFFRSPVKSFGWGLLTTAAIRSSSVTTSLVVPLVAKRVVTLKSAVPFILGANIGTTISAFVAAIANSNAAISIAIAHFLFNFMGILIFYPVAALRRIPVELAKGLGRLTMRYRLAGLLYLLVTFFFIPFTLIYFNRDAVSVTELEYVKTEKGKSSVYAVITKTFQNQTMGSWSLYNERQPEGNRSMYSVYRKGNILIINDELFELRRPGFCREGEDREGKYRNCIREIIGHLSLSAGVEGDSVYIFEKTYETSGMKVSNYISAPLNLVLKREKIDSSGQILVREELMDIHTK